MELIYDRNQGINLPRLGTITVIGCGGVGSWVAVLAAIHGCDKIILIDPDTIERTNLNRTFFKVSQSGKKKVEAIKELILERRPATEVVCYPKATHELSIEERKVVQQSEFILDCRDTGEPYHPNKSAHIYKLWAKPVLWVGYDGENFTLHVKPSQGKVVEIHRGYLVPSVLPTALLIANIYLIFVLLLKREGLTYDDLEPQVKTYTLSKFINRALDANIF